MVSSKRWCSNWSGSPIGKFGTLTYCNEPSALEGLVRGFIFSPLSFLIKLSSVDWPSWRSERHGPSFPRFPLGKRHLSRSLLFQLLFWSFRLGSNSPTLLLPGAGARSSFFSFFFQETPTQKLGHVQKVKIYFWSLYFIEFTFSFSLYMSPDVCLVAPRIGADTGVPSRE